MARRTGRLAVWDDERGFGFVEADDGARLFVHVSSIMRIATRPRAGDRLSFATGTGRDGRPAAVAVAIAGANPVDTTAGRRGAPEPEAELRDWFRVGGAFVIVILALAALVLDRAPLWAFGLYLGFGLFSAFSYLVDKRAAEAGQWRTSERFLLGLDLVGGIAGGLLAQQMLRHKTAKASFVMATLAISLLHVGLLSSLILGLVALP